MSYTTDLSLKNPRPRAQTFDGFLTRQRALYDRLFGQGRKQQIPVRDLTPGTKKIRMLSSYMIDPQYLDERGLAHQPFAIPEEDGLLGEPHRPRATLTNTKAGLLGLIKKRWNNTRFLIPQRYFKTFYSIDGGARTYLFTRTQKLAAVAATSTVGLTTIFTLALLHSIVDFPGYPTTPSVAAESSQAREVSGATTAAPGTANPVTTPESPAYIPTANPQPAEAPPSANSPTLTQPTVSSPVPAATTVPAADDASSVVTSPVTEATQGDSGPILTAPLSTIQETVDSATDLLGL